MQISVGYSYIIIMGISDVRAHVSADYRNTVSGCDTNSRYLCVLLVHLWLPIVDV